VILRASATTWFSRAFSACWTKKVAPENQTCCTLALPQNCSIKRDDFAE